MDNGQSTASSLSHATPSVTTTSANTMLVTAHAFASASSWTPPAGMIEAYDQASGTSNATGMTIEGSWVTQSAAGATGTKTATAAANADTGNTHILALRQANQAPAVSLISPANNASFTPPASITLTATATDSDGTVSKVEFFQGATLIGTVTSAPYTFNWTNVTTGSYSLTAKATDNVGAATTSGPVAITVDTAPSVSLTSPVANSNFTPPASITLTATATDPDGTVSKVEFFQGATLIGTVTSAPYTFNWTNVPTGSYSLTARATDNLGGVTGSSVTAITVDTPPAVSLTSPANNASFTPPASVTLTATATDSDGTVSKVEFFQGATLIGTVTSAPYTFNWTSVPTGSYTLTAKATDNLGQATTSTPVNITVSVAQALYFIHPDQINTPRLIANGASQTVWRWDNDEAFGGNIPNNNPGGLGAFTFNPRFPGQYFDSETGNHYNYFRDYSPDLGRYIESDPIGLRGGLNTYAYVGGDPIRIVDSRGLAQVLPGPFPLPVPGPTTPIQSRPKEDPNGGLFPPNTEPKPQPTFPEIRVPAFPPNSEPPPPGGICQAIYAQCVRGANACPQTFQPTLRGACLAAYFICATITATGGDPPPPLEIYMIELLYGTKDFSHIAWTEITGGRPVVLRVVGWKKTFVHRILSSYAEYDRLSRRGAVPRGLLFGLAWRTMLAPSLMGLCDHARSSGMAIVVRDRGTTLEVRFEKEQSGPAHE